MLIATTRLWYFVVYGEVIIAAFPTRSAAQAYVDTTSASKYHVVEKLVTF